MHIKVVVNTAKELANTVKLAAPKTTFSKAVSKQPPQPMETQAEELKCPLLSESNGIQIMVQVDKA
jgi:hypothetical protein